MSKSQCMTKEFSAEMDPPIAVNHSSHPFQLPSIYFSITKNVVRLDSLTWPADRLWRIRR